MPGDVPFDVPGDVPGDLRHFGWLHPKPSRHLQRPSSTFGLVLHRSLAWQSRRIVAGRGLSAAWASEGDVPGDVRHFGWLHPKPSRHLQRPPGTFGLVLRRSLAWQSRCSVAGRGLSAACPRPASSLLMGLRRGCARRLTCGTQSALHPSVSKLPLPVIHLLQNLGRESPARRRHRALPGR